MKNNHSNNNYLDKFSNKYDKSILEKLNSELSNKNQNLDTLSHISNLANAQIGECNKLICQIKKLQDDNDVRLKSEELKKKVDALVNNVKSTDLNPESILLNLIYPIQKEFDCLQSIIRRMANQERTHKEYYQ